MKKEYGNAMQVEEALFEWKIKLGIPLSDKRAALEDKHYHITVPSQPHIFFSKKLRLQEEGKTKYELSDVLVILGHAYVWGGNIKDWKFATGKSVLDTLVAYEEIADQFGFPQIDAVLACRNNPEILKSNVAIPLFVSEKYPYLFPEDKDVVIKNASGASWAKPGEGVGLLIADSGKWSGIKQWKSKPERKIDIPTWAKSHR